MNDYSELRAKAEALRDASELNAVKNALRGWNQAVTPDVVLSLLDEVERLRAALEAMMAAAGDFAGDYSFGPLSPSLVCPTARDTWLGS